MNREISTYGCTEAELREMVETSMSFRYSGPGMVAASMLSDAQEMICGEYGKVDEYKANIARQYMNRAKWVIFNYVMDRENA
jgi:hypothetical protein